MQRYFVDNIENEKVILKKGDLHHIKNVMKIKPNENIEVVFENVLYLANINTYEDIKIIKKIKELEKINKIKIAVPVVKESKMDLMIQKLTELGAYEIIPFEASRSVVKIKNDKMQKKILRWQKIAKEASEQSKRISIPKIEKILKFNELIKLENTNKFVCSVNNHSENIKNCLHDLCIYDNIIFVIGPEGGLSEKEEQSLIENGYKPISLGNNVLRCETAPIFIMSAVLYENMR